MKCSFLINIHVILRSLLIEEDFVEHICFSERLQTTGVNSGTVKVGIHAPTMSQLLLTNYRKSIHRGNIQLQNECLTRSEILNYAK
jgi:hypothetical protein